MKVALILVLCLLGTPRQECYVGAKAWIGTVHGPIVESVSACMKTAQIIIASMPGPYAILALCREGSPPPGEQSI